MSYDRDPQHPGISEAYNPEVFKDWLMDPTRFQTLLPEVVIKLITTDVDKAIPRVGPVARQAYMRMANGAETLYEGGLDTMRSVVYEGFAEERGLITELSSPFLPSQKLPITFEELSEEQQAEWWVFAEEIPRDITLEAFKGIARLELPVITSIRNRRIRSIYKRLSTVPYMLATKLFPDLQDHEAKELFGCSRAEVFERAIHPTQSET